MLLLRSRLLRLDFILDFLLFLLFHALCWMEKYKISGTAFGHLSPNQLRGLLLEDLQSSITSVHQPLQRCSEMCLLFRGQTLMTPLS